MVSRAAAALLLLCAWARAARAEPLERAVRELAGAARSAGIERIAVPAAASANAGDAVAARDLPARLAGLFAREGRVASVQPRGVSAHGSTPAQAVLISAVIREEGRRRALVRLVSVRTGVLLAAADAELPAPPEPARARLFDRARALLGDAPAFGPGKVEAEDRLIALLNAPGGARAVRAPATLALGRLGGARALAALGAAIGDPDPEVRGAAALALGMLGDPAGLARVKWAARADADEDVRLAAALFANRD